MTTKKLTKLLALYLPYLLLGLVATNLGEAWRLAEGKELGDKIMSMRLLSQRIPTENTFIITLSTTPLHWTAPGNSGIFYCPGWPYNG